MKKTVRESVIDYDMALLRVLAETRGAMLTSNHQPTAAAQLAAQLTDPTLVAIALTDLSPGEAEALAALQAAGGWMEMPRFARRFGNVRAIGPGRLERERPWLSPANPAEGLWYRGLIFKGFRQTRAGVVEVAYIASDLLSLLPEASQGTSFFTLEPATKPTHIHRTNANLVEDMFSVLVYVRTRDVRLDADGALRPKDLQAVNALCVSPVPGSGVGSDDRLAFVFHLCRELELVTVAQGHLALNPDRARTWLQAPHASRLLELQETWRDDPGWNDLWHVPSLKPQPTGWKNDPILARRTVLDWLVECQPGVWYRLDAIVAAIKSAGPDFQRPDGDYTTWYIHDLHGQPLMGFEHWDEVEGALLRTLLSGPLHWLGVIDLGFEEGFDFPFAFQLAETGLPFLGLSPLEGANHLDSAKQTLPSSLVVSDDFTVGMPLHTNLYDRFQLSRFADLVGRGEDLLNYRISPASLAHARKQGITVDQIGSFLTRASGQRVPRTVMDGLRRWYKRSGTVRIERSVVLQVDHPEILTALRRDPAIRSLLGEVLGPRAVLVPESNMQQVRRWLMEQGYLDTDKSRRS